MSDAESLFTRRSAASRPTRRERLPWQGDTYRILSIDGGGIKGLFAAELLKRLEDRLPNGQAIRDYFDLIAGTSTGGIIALALGLGLSTDEITDFYKLKGKKIFPDLTPLGRWLRRVRQLFLYGYDQAALERELKDAFQDKCLGESKCRLLIPAFEGRMNEVAVFRSC